MSGRVRAMITAKSAGRTSIVEHGDAEAVMACAVRAIRDTRDTKDTTYLDGSPVTPVGPSSKGSTSYRDVPRYITRSPVTRDNNGSRVASRTPSRPSSHGPERELPLCLQARHPGVSTQATCKRKQARSYMLTVGCAACAACWVLQCFVHARHGQTFPPHRDARFRRDMPPNPLTRTGALQRN